MTDYAVRRSRRRTMALEVTREGTALVRAPYHASDADIARFVEAHRAWLDAHIARRQAYLASHPAPSPQQIELLSLFEKVPDTKKSVVIDIVRSFTAD